MVNTQKLDVHHALLDFLFLDFFTTNQDLVLETVLADLRVPHVPIRSHKDLRTAKSLAFPRIVKFHGDLVATDEIVFTRQDINRRMQGPHPFDIYLQGRLVENAILFIGYGLNDPNVTEVWKRVQRYSSPGCQTVGFCLLVQKEEATIERMRGLGIEPVVVSVSDRKNPAELLEWLHEIRSKAYENSYRVSKEYLFHGKLAPARTLTRSQLQVIEKKLEAGKPANDLLREATYFQRIPQTLKQDVQDLLLSHIEGLPEFVWMWEVAFEAKMDGLAAAVLCEMRRRQSASRSSRFEASEVRVTIVHHFDKWAMRILMAHLEELKSDKGSEETLYLHVVSLFHCFRYLHLDEETEQNFKYLRDFYESRYPVIRARRNFTVSKMNALQRLTDGMRSAHVDVPEDKY